VGGAAAINNALFQRLGGHGFFMGQVLPQEQRMLNFDWAPDGGRRPMVGLAVVDRAPSTWLPRDPL
jgi:hypothetical protein